MNLASQYSASITFFDNAQKNLRLIYSECQFERECFKEKATSHIEKDFCPQYQDFNFVSVIECERAGQDVIAIVLGDKELAVPIRNTSQDRHNDRIYELERERLEQERRHNNRMYNLEKDRDSGQRNRVNSSGRIYDPKTYDDSSPNPYTNNLNVKPYNY